MTTETTAEPVRILHAEDDASDAELVLGVLEAGGFVPDVVRVDTREEFVAELERGATDAILSDYTMPSFDGLSALDIARRRLPDVPFLFVSGTIGEETAVEALKRGAADYVLKDRLSRLPGALRRSLLQAAERVRLREAEARLLQAQKMEAIGRLAGGVAHDFNNILTVIEGYAEILGAAVSSDSLLRAHVEAIRDAGRRATSLTHQLLAFSRQEVVQPVVLNLGDVISRMGDMLGRLIGEDVRLDVAAAATRGCVRVDRGRIEQVIMNLVVNARDATPSGGTITIRTTDVAWDALRTVVDDDLRPGPYVAMSVSDTGVGMSPEVLARIFEPFFTTKPRGEGTGLGLATVHGIVKQSGGHVRVSSAPGRGATFEVFLPCVDDRAQAGPPTGASADPLGGTETVVLAEDNDGVRSLLRTVLARHGYAVLAAEDGVEAAELIEEHGGRVDLLVTDVVMPKMGGPDLAAAARRTVPDLRVLYLSGYTERAAASRIGIEHGAAFLQKPFSAESFLRKVRDVLAARSPA